MATPLANQTETDLPFRSEASSRNAMAFNRFQSRRSPQTHQWKDTRKLKRKRRLAVKRIFLAGAGVLMLGCGAWAASKVTLPKGLLSAAPAASMKKSLAKTRPTVVSSESAATLQIDALAANGFVCYSKPEVLAKGQMEKAALQLEHGMARSGAYLENSIVGEARGMATVGVDTFTLKGPAGLYSSDYGWSGRSEKPTQSTVSESEPQKFSVSGPSLSCFFSANLGFESTAVQQLAGSWNPADQTGQLSLKCDKQALAEVRKQIAHLTKAQPLSDEKTSVIWEALPVSNQRLVIPASLLKRFTSGYSSGVVDRLALAHHDDWVGVSLDGELCLNRTAGLLQQFTRGDLPLSFVALGQPQSSGWFGAKTPAELLRVDVGQMPPSPGKAAKRVVPKDAIGMGSFQLRATNLVSTGAKDEAAPQLQTCDWSLFLESDGFRVDYKLSPNGSLADEPNIVAGPELEGQHRTKPNLWMGK